METMGFVIDLSVNVDVDTPVRNFGFVDVRSLQLSLDVYVVVMLFASVPVLYGR